MSYQVLARKWRPRRFEDVVGQEHVLRALSNALTHDRLHHAYLFTGTRGSGKTTLARILAKCLNCETGVTATPCGECSACVSIDQGRFVDLIEVDAASRAKVDETRDLMDNVQYAPSVGRFKVYLIDEVHMFSGHSFNALLKTLEEPPPHVKFLLATTEPKKIPITILSRCIQFNLKHLSPTQIEGQLQRILDAETVDYDPAACRLIAQAADGSLRDALSLLDQAIAFGDSQVREAPIREMLGTLDRSAVLDLLDLLAGADAAALLARVDQLAEQQHDYAAALAELLHYLHRIALLQTLATAAGEEEHDERLQQLAESLSPEDVQLYYQIALHGRRDLAISPDPRAGFEMTLIRMLAFRPDAADTAATPAGSVPAASGRQPVATAKPARATNPAAPVVNAEVKESPAVAMVAETRPGPATKLATPTPANWQQLISQLGLNGLAGQLAGNCSVKDYTDGKLQLVLAPDNANLLVPSQQARLQATLREHFNPNLMLTIMIEQPEAETPAQAAKREAAERKQAAVAAVEQDPVVQAFQETFNAEVDYNAVEPK
ncbi:MAG: DNA polymerase III subunit gamma/tau [Gammaproteobacteria bacterium]